MKITVLGYYGGYPSENVGTTGYLVQSGNYNLLLDAGSGTLLELQRHLNPLDLDAVLLTHYHHDHTADLGVLQYQWQLNSKNKVEILPIYGHTEDPLNFGALTWPNASQGVGYNENEEIDLGPFTVSFKKTIHPVPAFATRIVERETGKIFTFTSDTRYFDELVKFATNSDLLVTDTNFLSNHTGIKGHLSTKETAELFNKSNAKQLMISHLSPQIDIDEMLKETKQFSKNKNNIFAPKVGLTIEI
ncbi:MAG: MBL fold metallo-hydrolase [Pediococcus pentosaceus]|jgi:ribonuclease BN (tRNA processing enzyme)|nr:MBL fold metallo-hydrolase [Pediococcus pentosaceus]MCI1594263.1 MBL fold metallo-hydrolase [Pediococcus pentosaceus]